MCHVTNSTGLASIDYLLLDFAAEVRAELIDLAGQRSIMYILSVEM